MQNARTPIAFNLGAYNRQQRYTPGSLTHDPMTASLKIAAAEGKRARKNAKGAAAAAKGRL